MTVLSQPDRDAQPIVDALNEALAWDDVTRVWLAVAWAKRSGLSLLELAIRRLRARRKSVRALIGVDQHGATEEALRMAMTMFSEARVYHDSALFRTFHPKLYVVEARSRARAVIGSGNLTEGGLLTNYELALQVDLDTATAADTALLDELRSWFELRWNEPRAARKLTPSSIDCLLHDHHVVVLPEAALPPPRQPRTSYGARGESIFGPPVSGLRQSRREPVTASDASDALTPAEVGRPLRTGSGARDLVLAGGVTLERQRAFNKELAESFFGVSRNGETIRVVGVDRQGGRHGMPPRPLIFSDSNKNRRFEMPDPEPNRRASGNRPIILVRRLARRRFEYLLLYPRDPGYTPVQREIERRPKVGRSTKRETKRVYLTLGDVRNVWPGCPF